MNTVDLAKDIVSLCRKHKYEFNSTKIQKLLYLFLGFALMNDAIDETNQFDELPEAWPYGPVFKNVYDKYNSEVIKTPNDHKVNLDENIKKILEKTVKEWGDLPAGRLSFWSHEEGGPWHQIIKVQSEKFRTKIPADMIYNYFSENMENVLHSSNKGIISKLFN